MSDHSHPACEACGKPAHLGPTLYFVAPAGGDVEDIEHKTREAAERRRRYLQAHGNRARIIEVAEKLPCPS